MMDPLSLLLAAPLLATTPAPPTTAPIDPTSLVLGIQDDADADVPVEEKSPWTGSIGLGLTLSRTTTNTLGFNFGASATRLDVMSSWNMPPGRGFGHFGYAISNICAVLSTWPYRG